MCLTITAINKYKPKWEKRIFYKVVVLLNDCIRSPIYKGHKWTQGWNRASQDHHITNQTGLHCFFHFKDAEKYARIIGFSNGDVHILAVLCHKGNALYCGTTNLKQAENEYSMPTATFSKVFVMTKHYKKALEALKTVKLNCTKG